MAPGSAPIPRRRPSRAALQVEALEPRFLLARVGTLVGEWPGLPTMVASPPTGLAQDPEPSPVVGRPGALVVGPHRSDPDGSWDLAIEDAGFAAASRPGPISGPILAEVREVHDQPDRAQPLPIDPQFGVVGMMDVSDQMDMYQLPVDPGEHAFRLDLHMAIPPGAASELVSFYGPAGEPLVSFPIPARNGELSVIAHEKGFHGRSALYIAINRISDRSAAGTIVTNSPYWLQVTRLDPSGPPVSSSLEALSIGAGPSASGGRPLVPATPAPLVSDGVDLVLTMPIGARQGVVGTWPLVSSGSAGGVLDNSRPVQPAPRGDETALDLDLIDLPVPADDPVEPGTSSAGPGDPGARSVALRSAGGFPLLGSGRRGTHGPRRPILVDRPAPTAAPLPVEESPMAKVPDPRPASRRLPLRASLGVAAALALGLFLPDLAVVLGPAARWRSRPRASGPRRTPSRAR